MKTTLRLGVIGLSPGNGHPYSWSAICNGYEPTAMEDCGFPSIPRYLEKQTFPEDAIPNVRVTQVWTQDPATARHIARAAYIGSVVERPTDMIGLVDGILLARDDAESHIHLARPFLENGLPVYVDKPLAVTRADADLLLNLQKYPGQLFSCSALRYASELELTPHMAEEIGTIFMIQGVSPKYWDTYAVHVIEPLLLMAPSRGRITASRSWQAGDTVCLHVCFSSGLQAQITTTGAASAPIGLRVYGERGWKDLQFYEPFTAFKRALEVFVTGIRCRKEMISKSFMQEVVDLIELGRGGGAV